MNKLSQFLRSISNLIKLNKIYKKHDVITLYAETDGDWTFLDSIYEVVKKKFKNKIIRVCSDINDKYIIDSDSFFIGYGIARTIFFSNLKSKIFILTLSDLNNYFLKKSVHKVHYIYAFHSLASIHRVYNEKAFNAYDAFLCAGKHHNEELNKLCNIYNLDKKYFINYGYPKLDKIISEIFKTKDNIKVKDLKTILIAPTWGKSQISFKDIQKIMTNLISKYKIILRFHPMTIRNNKKNVHKLVNYFKNNKNFKFDNDLSSINSFVESSYLITEWSGSAFEFAFSKLKPIIFINTDSKINNNNWKLMHKNCFEEHSREKIGYVLNLNKIDLIEKIILEIDKNLKNWNHQILKYRDENIYNVGKSYKSGGELLIEHINRINYEEKFNIRRNGS